jgi:hypothetical protein
MARYPDCAHPLSSMEPSNPLGPKTQRPQGLMERYPTGQLLLQCTAKSQSPDFPHHPQFRQPTTCALVERSTHGSALVWETAEGITEYRCMHVTRGAGAAMLMPLGSWRGPASATKRTAPGGRAEALRVRWLEPLGEFAAAPPCKP